MTQGTTSDGIVVKLEYNDLKSGKDLTAEIAKAFDRNGLGILLVRGHPELKEKRSKLLPLARKLALLPPDVLQKYEREEAQYCIGWSRGREKFKGKSDVAKGSFYANPIYEDPANGDEDVRAKYPYCAGHNIWPEEIPELKTAFKEMGEIAHKVAQPIMQQCDRFVAAQHPSHGTRLYDMTFGSRMIAGRLLHYYAGTEDSWCGWHNDNSTITALVPAMWFNEETGEEISAPSTEAGLYVKGRDGAIHKITIPGDCLGFQIGEASQIISGGTLMATPHHVRGHSGGSVPISRETFAMFMEPQWDQPIGPPAEASYQEVLRGEETELIPPLSKRLKPDPKTSTVVFGKLLADSFVEYYAHNNPGEAVATAA